MVRSWGVWIKDKYGKVTDIEIKWLIIRKSVTIIIFVEFIDQLTNYPIWLIVPALIISTH